MVLLLVSSWGLSVLQGVVKADDALGGFEAFGGVATSAMRMRPAPGLWPWAVAAPAGCRAAP